jgi:hypothetical protein
MLQLKPMGSTESELASAKLTSWSATVHGDWSSYKNMTAAMKTYFH